MHEIIEDFKCELSVVQLLEQLIRQLSNFFILSEEEKMLLENNITDVLYRCKRCFESIDNKYFTWGGLNPNHSGQWLIFLYYFSNTCSNQKGNDIADKLYYLNKIMHGVDIYHAVNLPKSFFFEHPVGSVFGRAEYGNNFFAMQSCTVGGNRNRKSQIIDYPIIGNSVKMYSGSKIIGKCLIGNNVTLAANAYIKNIDIPDNATVFGMYPNITIKYL